MTRRIFKLLLGYLSLCGAVSAMGGEINEANFCTGRDKGMLYSYYGYTSSNLKESIYFIDQLEGYSNIKLYSGASAHDHFSTNNKLIEDLYYRSNEKNDFDFIAIIYFSKNKKNAKFHSIYGSPFELPDHGIQMDCVSINNFQAILNINSCIKNASKSKILSTHRIPNCILKVKKQ